jgi:hypothetical protein
MAEDFYIKFDSATRWEGKIHYLVAESNIREKINALMPLLYRLIQSQADPSGDHIWLCISTDCQTCNVHFSFQSNKIPSWAIALADKPEVKEFFEKLHKHGEHNG